MKTFPFLKATKESLQQNHTDANRVQVTNAVCFYILILLLHLLSGLATKIILARIKKEVKFSIRTKN